MVFKNEMEFQRFIKALELWNKDYDPVEEMIKRPFSSPGYHTALKDGYVHLTRESLEYAVALLDSGIEEYIQRAFRIIKKVISLQDVNPDSKTYGIWSWFYEEPLDRMSPPDWNWADFCGKQLLQVVLSYTKVIPQDINDSIKQSILHACNSILKRNVNTSYTNIAIMDTYVTLLAGELLENEEVFFYGKKKLKDIYEYTRYNGSFTEYNSPTYTIVALEDLSRILNHIRNDECLSMAGYLNRIGWKCFSEHFHRDLLQWAGPHSRCYSTLQDKVLLSRIQLACNGKVKILDEKDIVVNIDWSRILLCCPDEFIPGFKNNTETKMIRETFQKNDKGTPKQMASCYMSPLYTAGTFYQSDLWNQRRPLIAYLKTSNGAAYMQLKCIHDGYDYSSAIAHTVQSEGDMLTIINFAENGGDKHISLDMVKNACIKTKDLRIRFEFGGNISNVKIHNNWNRDAKAIFELENIFVNVSIPYCKFGDNNIKYEIVKYDEQINLDIILYSGDEKVIDFKNLTEAVCASIVNIKTKQEYKNFKINENVEKHEDELFLNCNIDNKNITLCGSLKPDKIENLYRKTHGILNELEYYKYFYNS